MTDVKVCTALLDYADQLVGIRDILWEKARPPAQAASASLTSDDPIYQGEALDALRTFYVSYADHVDKLYALYGAASEFLNKAFQAFDEEDRRLAWSEWAGAHL